MFGRNMKFTINNDIFQLRPFKNATEWQTAFDKVNKQSIVKYMDYLPFGRTDKTFEELFDSFSESNTTVMWAIEDVSKNTIVGRIHFFEYHKVNRTASITILIWNDEYWNKNIGYYAYLAALKYAVNVLNLVAISAYVFEPHKISIKLMEKLGFYRYGELPSFHYVDGHYVSSYHYVWYNPLERQRLFGNKKLSNDLQQKLVQMANVLKTAEKEINCE